MLLVNCAKILTTDGVYVLSTSSMMNHYIAHLELGNERFYQFSAIIIE